MRRRITLAVVAILAIALTLAGAVSLLLVGNAENNAAQARILSQARAIVNAVNPPPGRNGAPTATPLPRDVVVPLINVFQKAGVNAGVTTVTGNRVQQVPAGISPSAINVRALAAGRAVSGVSNGLAFAVVPLLRAENHVWVDFSLTAKANSVADNIWLFLLAGGISLLIAGIAAAVISRRIAHHVTAASGAAEKIAEGDLATRVPVARTYPELADLGNSINTMAENLERSRNLEREFLLSVSHDLRTPLTSIRGYSEAIADGLVADPERAAGVVVAESTRLARLIGDLLDLAKIEARQFSVHLAPVDAREAVERAAEALRYEFEGTGIGLALDLPDEPVVVNADVDRLVQVVGNLVDNALKFAAASIAVGVEQEGREVRIAVRDDGPGIDPEDLERIFDRHFSSNRRAARAGGSGLGLAIVAELVAAMGGSVAARSPAEAGHGTAVVVTLPAATGSPTPLPPVEPPAERSAVHKG